ncbi:MAG: hypothetical protein LBH44_13925 [Treponema sp.]|nr:hypothetical protein [Treponema sp.]
MTINRETIRAPHVIFFLYMLAASLLIIVFRFIFPGAEPPLLLFSREWRLVRGALELFDLFPSLAFSALVIPFGLAAFEDFNPSFSKFFFKRMLGSVITAICAAVIYGGIFFFAFPMVKDYEENLRFTGELYRMAKDRAYTNSWAGEWHEASQFLSICDHIWLNNPDLSGLKNEIEINLSKLNALEYEERTAARTALAEERHSVSTSALHGEQQPVTAAQAITMSKTAFDEHRFYDAHWLAALGERIAIEKSPEAATAARLAGEAWNKIESQSPNPREKNLYSLYDLKRSGYLAMNAKEWIRAYYIFLELIAKTPDDPDVVNFLAASERGTTEVAFFIDEMQLSLGEILTGAVFSLPSQKGRAVLRFSSLSTSQDYAYGMDFEYMSFDDKSKPLISVYTPYAKLLPFVVDGEDKTLVLLHALDRHNKNISWDGEWLVGKKTSAGILLDVSFEEFLLLSQVRHGLSNLQIDVLFTAAKTLGNAGYVSQIFEAEILNRLGSMAFFLPMAVFVIIIGWRFRAKSRPRYLFVPFFAVLPIVFHGFVFLYRSVLNTLGIWLVLSLGFSVALGIFVAVLAVSFLFSLILLAAQHG